MRTGKVKFFIESKGFGFITDDETGKDIFVHATGLRVEGLREGERLMRGTQRKLPRFAARNHSPFPHDSYEGVLTQLRRFKPVLI